MNNNQSDGTDWGDDDNQWKCGPNTLSFGAWFIIVCGGP